MLLYMAPLEGITKYSYRNIHRKHFAEADRYFTPFISMSRKLSSKVKNDIEPSHNEGIDIIPQIMVANTFETLYLSNLLLDKYGYNHLNINAGCPSGTVVTKYRGAGLLRDHENLHSFLEELFSESRPTQYSIKLRMGYKDVSEWENISKIIGEYPFTEVIIHGRVREEFYNGTAHRECLHIAGENIKSSICYNGDIYTYEDYSELTTEFPWLEKVMIGRGILRNPGLFNEIKTKQPTDNKAIFAFMDELFESYLDLFRNDINTLYHIKELWFYLGQRYPEKEKDLKIIRKTKSIPEYKDAVRRILL